MKPGDPKAREPGSEDPKAAGRRTGRPRVPEDRSGRRPGTPDPPRADPRQRIWSLMLLSCTTYAIAIVITAIVIASAAA